MIKKLSICRFMIVAGLIAATFLFGSCYRTVVDNSESGDDESDDDGESQYDNQCDDAGFF